ENGRSCSVGDDVAIFLISRRSGSVNVFGRPPAYFGYSESNPSAPKVVDDVADPIGAGEGDFGDLCHRHALGGEQDHLDAPPGHHRSGATADDPHQPLTFVIVEFSHSYSFCHSTRLADAVVDTPQPVGVSTETG